MSRNTFYLAAPKRTQDLLNIKWALRTTGYTIGSTWHDSGVSTSHCAFEDQWNEKGMERLQVCDSLAVICGSGEQFTPELATIAGFALARGLRVICIGSTPQVLKAFRNIQHFNTAEDFRQEILQRMYSEIERVSDKRLAA